MKNLQISFYGDDASAIYAPGNSYYQMQGGVVGRGLSPSQLPTAGFISSEVRIRSNVVVGGVREEVKRVYVSINNPN